MMNEERWTKLRETFDNEANFEKVTEDGYTEEWYTTGIPGDLGISGELMDWLECTSTRPSYDMIREFRNHGYSVYPGDHDSFGWLVGIVHDSVTDRKICFG